MGSNYLPIKRKKILENLYNNNNTKELLIHVKMNKIE